MDRYDILCAERARAGMRILSRTLTFASQTSRPFQNHEQCARALIEAGATVNHAANGATALMLSAQNGHEHCARALIEAGARKDLETKKGSTALSLARSNGHTALYALLENS